MMVDNRVLMAALVVRDLTGLHKMPTYLCCIENQAKKCSSDCRIRVLI